MAGTEVYRLGGYEGAVKRGLAEGEREGRGEGLWKGGSTPWAGGDGGGWGGWGRIVGQMQRTCGDP